MKAFMEKFLELESFSRSFLGQCTHGSFYGSFFEGAHMEVSMEASLS
jgi:hypothetical protein